MQTILLLVLVVLAAAGTTKTYSYLAARGTLGDEARDKYLSQSQGKFGLLVGGRPETLISWRAVIDSPFLGHGSWAEDRKYTEMFGDILAETGYSEDDPREEFTTPGSYMIPLHSFLMGAWVWAGFLGALFWIYILYLNGKATLRLAAEQPPLSPYLAYLFMLQFWNVLFSPFGHTERMDQAILFVMICSLLETTASRSRGLQNSRTPPTRLTGFSAPFRASVTFAILRGRGLAESFYRHYEVSLFLRRSNGLSKYVHDRVAISTLDAKAKPAAIGSTICRWF